MNFDQTYEQIKRNLNSTSGNESTFVGNSFKLKP
jgi:hypothetical protein